MIDLSRMWHDLESIRNVIDMASLYKIKYLQLHLSDDQAFVFPTNSFPNLPTPDRPYSIKDFKNLEGELGYFAQKLNIYGLKTCKRCKSDTSNIVIAGRSSYFCKKCQK